MITNVQLINNKNADDLWSQGSTWTRKHTNLHFRFLHRLYHVLVIACEIKEASTLTRRWELSESLVSTKREHIVCGINLEQLAQCPTFSSEQIKLNCQWSCMTPYSKCNAYIMDGSDDQPEYLRAVILPFEITRTVWRGVFWAFRREPCPYFLLRVKSWWLKIKRNWTLLSYCVPVMQTRWVWHKHIYIHRFVWLMAFLIS